MKSHPIILASDHAGFALKEAIKAFLHEKGYAVDDMGAHALDLEDDYPPFMAKAAMEVAKDMKGYARAVIFGGSGEGEAIVANRFPGVRATAWYGGSHDILKFARTDNDSNVLSIGARFVSESEAKEAVIQWLETPFSGEERHKRRIEEIDNIE